MKRLSTVGVAGLLLTATLMMPPGIAGAEEEPPEQGVAAADSDAAADRYQHFRQSLGFSTEAVVMVAAERATNDSRTVFGVPLTDDEFVELTERQDVIEEDAALIRSAVTTLLGDDGYAGLWMDNHGGGRLTVGVTTRADEVLQAVRQQVANPERVVVHTLPRSLADLEELAKQVRNRAAEQQLDIATARADERTNGLEVLTSEDTEGVRQWLSSWLPADLPLLVEAGSVTSTGTKRMESPPFRVGSRSMAGDTHALLPLSLGTPTPRSTCCQRDTVDLPEWHGTKQAFPSVQQSGPTQMGLTSSEFR